MLSALRTNALSIFVLLLCVLPLAVAAPAHLFLSPVNGITGVGLTEQLTMTFSEPVTANAGGTIDILRFDNDNVFETISVTSVNVGGSGTSTITVSPALPREENTRYWVKVSSNAFTGSTGPYPGILTKVTWSWTTSDISAPTYTSLVPASGSVNVDGSAAMKISFNENVRAFTGSMAQITVKRSADSTTLCSISCSASTNFQGSGTSTITLVCPSKLPDTTPVVVTIPDLCISDLSDNPFVFTGSWTFTTGDYTRPTLVSFTPTHLSANVPLTQALGIQFSEAVYGGSGSIVIKRVSDGVPVTTISASSGNVGGGGTPVITITPTSPLPDSVSLYVEVGDTAFRDSNNNYFAGFTGPGTWQFTTIDVTRPTVLTRTPAHLSTGASTTADLVLKFSERVIRVGGTVQIRSSTGTLLQAVNVMTSSVQGSGTDTIRFLLSAPLPDLTGITVIVPGSSFQDASGNYFLGYAVNEWAFTTGDFTPPTAVSVVPLHLSTNVQRTASVSITFSEIVLAKSGTIRFRRTSDLADIVTTPVSSITGNNTLVLTIPHDPFPDSTEVTVEVPSSGITDASGNAFAGFAAGNWKFTIGDFTPPVITILSPTLAATNVPVGATLIATFSENIAIVDGTTLTLSSSAGVLQTVALNDTARVTVSGAQLRIAPNPVLPADTVVWVLIANGAITDTSVNRNVFPGITSSAVWNFTTVDLTPPTVVSLVPAINSVGARTNASLVVTFSEPVQTFASGSIAVYRKSDNALLRTVLANAGVVTGSGTNTLTVAFGTQHLPENTEVYALIGAQAVADLAVPPNYFLGFTTSTQWPWTTGDWAPPEVVTYNPAPLFTTAALTVKPTMTFNKAVTVNAGGVLSLRLLTTNAAVENFTLPSAAVTGSGTATITITPTQPLLSETWYYITATEGSFLDVSTNRFAGILLDSVWRFRTADVTPPTLITTTPLAGATAVATTTALSLTFSEAVMANPSAQGSVLVFNSATGALVANLTSTSFTGQNTTVLTASSSAPLPSETLLHVLINNTAFTDLALNAFAGISNLAQWTFTTRDDTPPAIISLTPANNSAGVSQTSALSISFSENVQVKSGSLLVRRSSDSLVYATIDVTSAAVTGSGTSTLHISTGVTLPAATQFFVSFPSSVFADMSNNFHPGFIFPYMWTFTTYDNLPPVVTAQVPMNASTGVGLLDPIIVTFNKPVSLVNGSGTISLVQVSTGSVVESWTLSPSVAITGGGTNTLTLTRTVSLVDLTTYYIYIPGTAVHDVNNNYFLGYGATNVRDWSFTTGDLTPPTHTLFSPLPQAVKVPVGTALQITFSKVVRARTTGGLYITVYRFLDDSQLARVDVASTTQITGSGTQVITATLPSALPEYTLVYVLVSAGAFEDSSGRAYAGIASKSTWTFTTADMTNPVVAVFSPAPGATGVPITTNLVMTFSEVVYTAPEGLGTLTIYRNYNNFVIERIPMSTAAMSQIQGNGTNIITVSLSNPLPSTAIVYMLISSNAFVDRAGNPYAGTNLPSQWYFSTTDNSPPAILAVSPIEESVGNSVTTHLVIVFDEAVSYGGGLLSVFKWSDNTTALSMSIAASSSRIVQTTFAGQHTVDITTNVRFEDSTLYYVLIGPDAFYDLSGNPFPGITSAMRWRFTTGDFTPPSPVSYTPARSSSTASPTGPAVLRFNENVQLAVGARFEIRRDSDNALVEALVAPTNALTVSGATVTIAHQRLLDVTAYHILLSANGVTDMHNNSFAGFASKTDWAFVTRDATPPTIVQLSPATGSTGVRASPSLLITFSEPVTLTGPGGLSLYRDSDLSLVESFAVPSARVSLVGTGTSAAQVSVAVSAALADFTRYYVTIDANTFPDLAGNYFAGLTATSSWYFTTGDNTPPTLVSSSPANGSASAPVAASTPITLSFSEVVYARAGSLFVYTASTGAIYDTVSLTSTTAVSGSGSTNLYFTLSKNLAEGTRYYLLLPSTAVSDANNNFFAGFTSPSQLTFTTGHFTPPTVSAYLPAVGSTNVALNAQLVLTMSTSVVSVASGTITVYNNATSAVVATIATPSAMITGFGTNVITLNQAPSTWPDSTLLTVVVPAGVWADNYNNHFAGLAFGSWYFTTIDVTPPQVVSLVPVNGATRASTSATLFITFNEPVKIPATATGTFSVYKTADGSLFGQVSCATSSASITGQGTATLGFTLPSKLTDVTQYYVTVSPTCVSDASNNMWSGYSLTTDWAFTTGDFTAPVLVTTTPAHGATAVSVDTTLTITFNEPVYLGTASAGTAYFRVARSSDGSQVRIIPASAASGYGTNTIVVTLKTATYANAPLPDSTQFCVLIDQDAVKDQWDNSYLGLSGCGTWSFTTQDLVPPQVVSLTPAVSATGVAALPVLSITFNEPVTVSTDPNALLTVAASSTGVVLQSTAVSTALTSGANTPTLIFALPGPLPEQTLCVVTVTSTASIHAISDLSGNAFTGFGTGVQYAHPGWNFTTGDFTPPTLVARTPANTTTRVNVWTEMVMLFSEPVQAVTAAENTAAGNAANANRMIEVYRQSDNMLLYMLDPALPQEASRPNASALAAAPTSDLLPSTTYYVVVGSRAIRDLGGNMFAGIAAGQWVFTTETPPLFTYTFMNHTVYGDGTRMKVNAPIVSAMPVGGPVASYSIVPNTLPAGVVFDTSSGHFRGYPTSPSALATYSVTGHNGGGSLTVKVNLTVLHKPPESIFYTVPASNLVEDDSNSTDHRRDVDTKKKIALAELVCATTATTASANGNGSGDSFLSLAEAAHPTLDSFTLAATPTGTYYTNIAIPNIIPTVSPAGGPVTNWAVTPALPTGLTLDPSTGVISGIPRRASPLGAITYNITGSNSGGAAWTEIALDIKQGPIRFGVPDTASPATLALVQSFFDTVVSPTTAPATVTDPTQLSFTAVTVGAANDVAALDSYTADIVITDALASLLAVRRQDYRLLAVAQANPTTDYVTNPSPASVATLDAVAVIVNRTFTTFLQLKGRRACTSGVTNAIGASVLHWARTQSTASVQLQTLYDSVNGGAAYPTGKPHDSCDAPTVAMLDGFFGRTCAPPTNTGGPGRCSICPSIKDQNCSARNAFAGDAGALRGLLEGVCDVAFVHRNSIAAHCQARTGYTVPTWCFNGVTHQGVSILPEMLVTSKPAPVMPTRGLLIRPDTFVESQALRLQRAMVNYWHTQTTYASKLLPLFGPSTVRLAAPDLLAPGAATSAGVLALATTNTHLAQGSFSTTALQYAGVAASLACATAGACKAPYYATNCVNTRIGTAEDPIRVAVSKPLNASETFLLSNFFNAAASFITLQANVYETSDQTATIASASTSTASGSASAAAGTAASSIMDLHRGLVDVLNVDAGTAILASLRLGHVVFAVESATGPSAVSVVGLYRKTDPTHVNVAGPFAADKTDAGLLDFKAARSCHASFGHAAGMLLPSYYAATKGIFKPASVGDSSMVGVSSGVVDGCEGPLVTQHRAFFMASCAPPTTKSEPGICDLCDAKTPCDRSNRYAGESGALRGLAERACTVAFVKNTTYANVCGQGDGTPAATSSQAGYAVGRPSWCDLIPMTDLGVTSDLARVQSSLFSPADVYLIRRGSITADGLTRLRSTLQALNTQPAILATLSRNGGMVSIADPPGGATPGTDAATVSTLQTLEDTFLDYVPGFNNFLDCHGRSVASPDFTKPYCHSIPPTNCTGMAQTSGGLGFVHPSTALVVLLGAIAVAASYLGVV